MASPRYSDGWVNPFAELLDAAVRGGEVPKQTKLSVDYGPGMQSRHCSICEHYQRGGKCRLVAGTIRPEDWCKLFERKPREAA